jgi:hypothetical protein
MTQPYSVSLWIDSARVAITWAPGLGLTLRVLCSAYYETRPRHSFPHDGLGNVSALDIRRAQEEMISRARKALHHNPELSS